MTLGEKVKDVLHSDESKDTREDITRNTPGSYPSDDMTRREYQDTTGHEHNKLHKPNDPRGWTEDETSRGQDTRYDQSGSRDPTSLQSQQVTDRSNDPLERSMEGTTWGTTEGTTRLGENTNLASRDKVGGSTSSQEHPYWGDLPIGGVHNDAVGRGSAEDDDRRHWNHQTGTYNPESSTLASQQSGALGGTQQPLSGTSGSQPMSRINDAYASQHQPLSQTNDPPTQRQPLSQTNDPSTQRFDESQRTSGSRFNEGLAGAAVAGTAGAGAYELSKKHRDDKVDEPTSSRHDEEHKGRSFPLLGRGHKDTHKEEKHVKEDKHAKEPKKEHESKLGGLFHRSHKDETDPREEETRDKHHGSSAAPLAAAGAGGVTYAATRDHHRQHDTTGDPTRGDQYGQHSGLGSQGYNTTGSSARDPTQSYEQDRSRGYGGLATGAAAGLGAGVLASHGQHREQGHREQGQSGTGLSSGTSQYPEQSQHSGVGQPGLGQGYDTQTASSRAPTSQSYEQDRSHGHGGLATGAAAGLGAGVLASHAQRSGNDQYSSNDQYSGTGQHSAGQHSGASLSPVNTKTGSSTRDPSSQVEPDSGFGHSGLTAGAAGLGAGALASRSGQRGEHGQPDQTQYSSSGQSGLHSSRDYENRSSQPTQLQQQGSHGYDGLAAGTGHASQYSSRDLENQGSQPGSYARESTQQQQDSGGHGGLAGAAASGFGVGSLASGRDSGNVQHSSSDYGKNYGQPKDRLGGESGTQSYQTGTHREHGIATGAVTSLGGSHLTSQTDRHTGTSQHGLDNEDYTQGDRYSNDPSGQSYQQGSSGHGGLAAGLGAGALASHAAQHRDGQYSGLGSSRGSAQGNQGTDRFSNDPAAQSYQQEGSHQNTNLAGGAAGLGAAGLASHELNKRHGDNQDTTDNSSRGYQTGAGTSGNATTPRYGNDKNESLGRQNETTRSGEDKEPSLTQHANQGQYDALASGTPSGIRR